MLSDPEKKLIGALGAKKHPLGIIRSHWIFVDGVLKVKQIQVSPEVSFTSAEEEIKKFINENENGKKLLKMMSPRKKLKRNLNRMTRKIIPNKLTESHRTDSR